MNMKKAIIIIICLFVLSGCKIQNISDNNIEKNVDTILNRKTKYVNKDAIGYQYYLPKYMSIKNTNEFNQEIYFNGNTLYLYADVVSYYHKVKKDYKINKNAYISKKIQNNKKVGYLEVKKDKDKYYVEMMYNYAKIEGYCSKHDLIDTVNSMSYILSSIKYNNNVIQTLLGDKRYDLSNNQTYNIFKTKKNGSNFLDYVNEYDKYNGEDLNNLIEKEEIKSEDEED